MNAQSLIWCVQVYNKWNSIHWCTCTLHAKFALQNKNINSIRLKIRSLTSLFRTEFSFTSIISKENREYFNDNKHETSIKLCNCIQLIGVHSTFIGWKITIAHLIWILWSVQRNEAKRKRKSAFIGFYHFLTFGTWTFSCMQLMHASKRIRMCFACYTFIALNHIFERPKNERKK